MVNVLCVGDVREAIATFHHIPETRVDAMQIKVEEYRARGLG